MPVADSPAASAGATTASDLYAPTRLYGSARRSARVRRSRARARPRRHPRRRLQPPRSRRQLPGEFSPDYFTDRYKNDWGRALNFEGPAPAREFFVANAGYWIDEYHFDGLRLDATQDIHDASAEHVLPIDHRARAAAPGRAHLRRSPRTSRRTRGSCVRPTARRLRHGRAVERRLPPHRRRRADRPARGVLHDYRGSPQELISCAKYGYLYQGQWYAWQKQRRGTPGARPAADAPSSPSSRTTIRSPTPPFGRRLHQLVVARPASRADRAAAARPATPLLFQGRSSPRRRRSSISPTTRRSCATPCRDGRARVPGAVSQPARSRGAERAAIAGRRGHVRALQAGSQRARAPRRGATRCTATCCAAAERSGDRAAGDARSTARCSQPDAFVLRYFGGGAGDRLLDRQSRLRPRLRPGAGTAARAAGRTPLAPHVEQRGVRYGGQGTPPLDPHARLAPARRVRAALYVRRLAGRQDEVDRYR